MSWLGSSVFDFIYVADSTIHIRAGGIFLDYSGVAIASALGVGWLGDAVRTSAAGRSLPMDDATCPDMIPAPLARPRTGHDSKDDRVNQHLIRCCQRLLVFFAVVAISACSVNQARPSRADFGALWKAIETLQANRHEPDCVPVDATLSEHFEAEKLNELVGK